MKYLKSYKMFESLSYNADWKKHDSAIRAELERDLNDILLEITDLGFRSHISGWTKGPEGMSHFSHPYVWIRSTSKTPVPMIEHTEDVIERIKDYLSGKGYQTKVRFFNEGKSSMQIYIYFDLDLKDINESVNPEDLDYNLIEDVKDILLPFSDMGMKVSCDYTSKGDSIAINVMTSKEKAFDINEYKDDIDSLLSYMKENNWGILNFNLGIVEKKEDWSGTHLLPRSQQIISYPNGPLQYDKVKNPTFWITAEFVKIVYTKVKSVKESVESDTVKKDIEEICYELTDYGKFRVDIRQNVKYSRSAFTTGKEEKEWVVIISLDDHMDYDGFLLSEVEDTLMRIKSYLGLGRFMRCDVLLVGEQDRKPLNYISDEDRKNNINFPSPRGIDKLTDERITNIIIHYTL